MFKFLFNNKEEGDIVMSNTKLSKTQKIKNLFNKGATVTWKQLRTVYDLKSPAAMIGKLRNEGLMIYENRVMDILRLILMDKRIKFISVFDSLLVKKSEYETAVNNTQQQEYADCIRSDQVSAAGVMDLFKDKAFYKWYKKKYL